MKDEATSTAMVRIGVDTESDVAIARQSARAFASRQGLSQVAVEALATAVSELARNIIVHAWSGEIVLLPAQKGNLTGIEVVARDEGPGIADIEQALRDGYSTSRGLGLGLSGARRLADEFELESIVGQGTTVRLKKWARVGES
jgi:serine/threonine-protein kinase RsbT